MGLSFTGVDDGVDGVSVSFVGFFNSVPDWSTQIINRIRTPMATPAFKTPPSAVIPKRKALNTGASHPQGLHRVSEFRTKAWHSGFEHR